LFTGSALCASKA